MGFLFEQNTGSKGIIYDEGNNIILMTVGERINRQMLISRDYRSELCFLCDDDKARKVEPFEIGIRCEKAPKEIMLLPDGNNVSFVYRDGYAVFESQNGKIFNMYQISF